MGHTNGEIFHINKTWAFNNRHCPIEAYYVSYFYGGSGRIIKETLSQAVEFCLATSPDGDILVEKE